MSPRRIIDWRIVPGDDDDTYDLLLRGRRKLTNSSQVELQKYLKKHFEHGQTVFEIDKDGRVVDLTKRLTRRLKPTGPIRARTHIPLRMPLVRW